MAIPLSRYVDITSGVGAATSVANRELIGRIFTSNQLLPSDSQREFDSADAVGEYFGFSSEEYNRAVFYFSWISKNITRAEKISFARFTPADTAPQIFGAKGPQSIASWTPITTGAFSLTIGGVTESITGLNFSTAANLAAVAGIIQTAVRAADAAPQWANATVTYDAVRSSFNFTGGATGTATISVGAGAGGNDIANLLGWLDPVNTILSPGTEGKTPTETLSLSASENDNFGSFCFIPTLTNNEIVALATWNVAQNIRFIYSVRTLPENAAALSALLDNIGGVTITLAPISTEYPEQVPMMILAATDYTALNSTQNYMFQIFNLTPSVDTTAGADLYDGLRVNYYGQTQRSGNLIEFYQRGFMMGLPVDPAYQNVYANEIWLKDAAEASIMTLLLALSKVSANARGRSQLLAVLQSVINQALLNGTISVGKPLTNAQKLFIAEQTGDAKAWYQVQNQGYWFDVRIVPITENNTTQYKAVYTLIYSKDDVIRKVEGRDILI